jgi:hypothetical protein
MKVLNAILQFIFGQPIEGEPIDLNLNSPVSCNTTMPEEMISWDKWCQHNRVSSAYDKTSNRWAF